MSTASVNEVRLVGNVGADPELRTTEGGVPVLTLSIATTYYGGEVEKTEWHRVVLWKQLAERAHKYLRRGSSVWVAGHLQTRRWADGDVERWSTEIVAENFQMLGPKRAGEGEAPEQRAPKSSGPAHTDADLDDVPF